MGFSHFCLGARGQRKVFALRGAVGTPGVLGRQDRGRETARCVRDFPIFPFSGGPKSNFVDLTHFGPQAEESTTCPFLAAVNIIFLAQGEFPLEGA